MFKSLIILNKTESDFHRKHRYPKQDGLFSRAKRHVENGLDYGKSATLGLIQPLLNGRGPSRPKAKSAPPGGSQPRQRCSVGAPISFFSSFFFGRPRGAGATRRLALADRLARKAGSPSAH